MASHFSPSQVYRGLYFGLYDTVMPMVDKSSSATKFAVGYGVTVVAGLAAYPIDTVRGRMMLCPGGYPTALACAQSILANEGAANLFLS